MVNRIDPDLWESVSRSEIIRRVCREKLTPIQYRRIGLLYGFNNREPMTERQVAAVEGVYRNAVHVSHHQALRRLGSDYRLLLLWVTMWT